MSTVVEQSEFVPPIPPVLRWRSWPAREHPFRALAVLLGLALVGLVIWGRTGQAALAWLGPAAAAAALWRVFLPVQYTVDDEGISQGILGRRRRRAWQSFQAYEVCPTGLLLVPYQDFCPMDVARSVFLPCPPHRAELCAQARRHLGEPRAC
jgi:hypothetical protein